MSVTNQTVTCFWVVAAGSALMLAGCGGSSSSDKSDPEPTNVALSGVIDIETGTRVDFDNGDALVSNGVTQSTPQALPQEFILSGYVSAFSGSYPPLSGFPATAYPRDLQDTYTLTLAPGQSVELQVFATRDGTPSVQFALSQDGTSLASTTGSSGERLSLANSTGEEGTFSVRVEALGNVPLLYVLSSAVAVTGKGLSFSWPDHAIVEGEAIVGMPAGGRAEEAHAMIRQSAMQPLRELAPGVWQVKGPATMASARGAGAQADTLKWIESLRTQGDVASAAPNYRMQTMAGPLTEPRYPDQQWHYGLLNAPTAWQLAPSSGNNVTVAVMDTGLYQSASGWHSDLRANVVQGADFVSEQFDNDGQPGRDTNPADPGNAIGSSVYHGTHVAGTVAAVANDSGGVGVAFNSSLLPVRVLGEGGVGSSADLLAAIRWVNGSPSGSPRADIVNLSLGGLPFIQSLQDAINEGTDRGVVFVAAAGNSATSVESYPAAFNNVFSVSAVDGAGELASYSNFGNWIDLAAPGGDITRDGNADGRGDVVVSTSATVIDGQLQETYIGLQGTSMAAPHVSGVMALMKGINSSLNYQSLNALLIAGDLTTCSTEPCSKNSRLGWGLLDAGKATLAAQEAGIPELLTASPAIVSLSSEGAQSATVVLEAFGGNQQSVTIDSISAPPGWLTVGSDSLVGRTGTRFELPLTLNVAALGSGVSQRTTLVVDYTSDSARTLEIPVVGKLVTDQNARDAGRHFVLLVDPVPEGEFYRTVAQASVVAENGQYRFTFVPDDGRDPVLPNEVAPGDYVLVAGTDLDNDGLICHAGEACAEYPISGLREVITLQDRQSVTGIRMTTSYSRPSISAATPEMLPRPGFQGYQLLSVEPADTSTKAIAEP